jgi:hypothetical protein
MTIMENNEITTMERNPHEGTGAFTGGLTNTAPEPSTPIGQFKFKLARNGIPIGFIGLTGSQDMWMSVVTDESQAITWEWYSDTSGDYLKNPAWVNGYGTWSTGLAGQPLACNDWAHAGTFKLVNGHLIAGDGSTVGQYRSDLQWLYANSSYPALEVSTA